MLLIFCLWYNAYHNDHFGNRGRILCMPCSLRALMFHWAWLLIYNGAPIKWIFTYKSFFFTALHEAVENYSHHWQSLWKNRCQVIARATNASEYLGRLTIVLELVASCKISIVMYQSSFNVHSIVFLHRSFNLELFREC